MKRLATLMADLFGVRLATATIARISQDCGRCPRKLIGELSWEIARGNFSESDERNAMNDLDAAKAVLVDLQRDLRPVYTNGHKF